MFSNTIEVINNELEDTGFDLHQTLNFGKTANINLTERKSIMLSKNQIEGLEKV